MRTPPSPIAWMWIWKPSASNAVTASDSSSGDQFGSPHDVRRVLVRLEEVAGAHLDDAVGEELDRAGAQHLVRVVGLGEGVAALPEAVTVTAPPPRLGPERDVDPRR